MRPQHKSFSWNLKLQNPPHIEQKHHIVPTDGLRMASICDLTKWSLVIYKKMVLFLTCNVLEPDLLWKFHRKIESRVTISSRYFTQIWIVSSNLSVSLLESLLLIWADLSKWAVTAFNQKWLKQRRKHIASWSSLNKIAETFETRISPTFMRPQRLLVPNFNYS